MFTAEESWKMSETEKIVALIREIGVWRLSNCDGCMCGGFKLRNVEVDISCGKGRERAVWVDSRSVNFWDRTTSDDCDPELLAPIAAEVTQQVEASDGRGPMKVHFRSYARARDTLVKRLT